MGRAVWLGEPFLKEISKKLLSELYNLGTLFSASFIYRELFEICEFIGK